MYVSEAVSSHKFPFHVSTKNSDGEIASEDLNKPGTTHLEFEHGDFWLQLWDMLGKSFRFFSDDRNSIECMQIVIMLLGNVHKQTDYFVSLCIHARGIDELWTEIDWICHHFIGPCGENGGTSIPFFPFP